jgi:SNF2 family DNA or RNA helicase
VASLADYAGTPSEAPFEALLPRPEMALGLLLRLHAEGCDAGVEWPLGETLKVRQPPEGALRVVARAAGRWFTLGGGLTLDDGTVVPLDRLLAEPGEFMPLGPGQFLHLTESYRILLDKISALAARREGGPIVGPVIDLDIDGDEAWRGAVERRRNAPDRSVPVALQAVLRPYQADGFQWLCRLADWGEPGALLADDMGLGKTVQVLAMLLARSEEGPALVVAPASVVSNWRAEMVHFTPSLRSRTVGDAGRTPAAGDVFVCSYNALCTEDLQQFDWATVVYDEAQSLKNPSTQRWQAARQIQAGFTVALSGTPVENHLGDLWAIFALTCPGLLDTASNFRRRYAVPIQNDNNEQAHDDLRALIRPRLLRRTKAEVLTDLPPLFEQVRSICFSAEEASAYEALRQEAQAACQDTRDPAVLWPYLLRLRQTCCHPQLIGNPMDSSKLADVVEVLLGLRDGGHRALVFSQFVEFLHMVRQEIEARDLTCEYMDGQMTQSAKDRSVQAFEAGSGDAFLISLKTGGVGLNLVSADYVLILDPWWNPAVEAQAVGRAHRMGQKRAVTVYRYIVENSIESRITELHKNKQELADALLAESNVLSVDVLKSMLS